MTKENEENLKHRTERLLEIDIYKQAKRPRAEIQAELCKQGINAEAMAASALKTLKQRPGKRTQNARPSTPAEANARSLHPEARPHSRSEQAPASRRHARTPTPRATGLVQPFPRWSGRVNLPKGFEDAITSTADIPAREEEQLAISADTLPTEFWTKVWHVVDHDACLLISAQADPSKLEIIVTGAIGEPSDVLDGAKFLSPDGSEIAEIRDKCAVLEIARSKEGFILISPTGSPLKLAAK